MFNMQEYSDYVKHYLDIYPDNDWEIEEAWQHMVNMVAKDQETFDEFVNCMPNFSDDEYNVFIDIIDDIPLEVVTPKLIENLTSLTKKYPSPGQKAGRKDDISDIMIGIFQKHLNKKNKI